MKYEDLKVWQKGIVLVKRIYCETKAFPADEKFGLISQMRRSAVSIPTNIAEGHGRKSTKAYINHLSIVFGSLMELETLLKISNELKYLPKVKLTKLLTQSHEIGRMLNGLMTSLRKNYSKGLDSPLKLSRSDTIP